MSKPLPPRMEWTDEDERNFQQEKREAMGLVTLRPNPNREFLTIGEQASEMFPTVLPGQALLQWAIGLGFADELLKQQEFRFDA